jgi:exopolyphosphatase / guanosine-5'-triphosphate,3'-diphosphate pyrophosphatase
LSRYAAIDIGSNSTLLLIVERKHSGGVRVLVDTKVSTGLSAGAAENNSITPAAIQRQFAALEKLQQLLTSYHTGEVVVCATQVFRVASNGRELAAEISRKFGWQVEIIEGQREAELSYEAAATGLTGTPEERVVVDVGGGSTEVVAGKGEKIEFAESFPIGAVKLSELCSLNNAVSADNLSSAVDRIKFFIPEACLAAVAGGQFLISVGGTASTFAALQLGSQVFDPALVHGVRLSTEWLEVVLKLLAPMSVEERRSKLLFDPSRAEIIVAGGLILDHLALTLRCNGLTVSNRGLRWGALFDRYPLLAGAVIKQDGGA